MTLKWVEKFPVKLWQIVHRKFENIAPQQVLFFPEQLKHSIILLSNSSKNGSIHTIQFTANSTNYKFTTHTKFKKCEAMQLRCYQWGRGRFWSFSIQKLFYRFLSAFEKKNQLIKSYFPPPDGLSKYADCTKNPQLSSNSKEKSFTQKREEDLAP